MKIHSGEVYLSSALKSDLPELTELYNEASEFFGEDFPASMHSPEGCLLGLDLPKDGVPENYELLTIRVNDILIGYTTLYRDFPAKDYVDLKLMYIGEPARNRGFGALAAKMIFDYFNGAKYGCIRINVPLRNWGALRFFNRFGFNRILELNANGDCSDGEYGYVSLEKELSNWW